MLVEIRIYRRHDADLMMLKSYDVNISKLMRLALSNYAAGKRVKYRLPGSHPYDISNTSMLRYRLDVRDPDVIAMLHGVKKGYRNQFCKALLRDMLENEPLGVFLEDQVYIDGETMRLEVNHELSPDMIGPDMGVNALLKAYSGKQAEKSQVNDAGFEQVNIEAAAQADADISLSQGTTPVIPLPKQQPSRMPQASTPHQPSPAQNDAISKDAASSISDKSGKPFHAADNMHRVTDISTQPPESNLENADDSNPFADLDFVQEAAKPAAPGNTHAKKDDFLSMFEDMMAGF